MTRTEAIREATKLFGNVCRWTSGPRGWGYSSWSEKHQGWWQPSFGSEYMEAVSDRAASIASTAAALLLVANHGWDEDDADEEVMCDWQAKEDRGTVAQRVDALLQRALKKEAAA